MAHNQISPLALQWTLNETVDGFLKISKDVMIAATQDDVQGLALDAVEKFGTTLAICPATQSKISDCIRTLRGWRVLEILKAGIGFANNDSCDVLSRSIGGVRFLALAAALMTCSYFEAAQATEAMLRSSSRRDQLLPTTGQLQTLYKKLEYKLVRTGFGSILLQRNVDIVTLLRESGTRDDPLCSPVRISTIQGFSTTPQPATLAALIDAFREVGRLGEGDKIVIRANSCSIWIITFTEWCLGQIPKVTLPNGRVLYENLEEESCVELWAFVEGHEGTKEEVEISVQQHIDKPRQLWSNTITNAPQVWSGMVSIRDYGSKYTLDCGLDVGNGKRALNQALVYSTTLVLNDIMHGKPSDWTKSDDGSPENVMKRLQIRQPWGVQHHARRLQTLISIYLKLDPSSCQLKRLEEGRQIKDLPLVKQYMEELRGTCVCAHCSDDSSSQEDCSISWFEYYVSSVTAQLIALSLLVTSERVLLCFNGDSLAWDKPDSQTSALRGKIGKTLFPDSNFRKSLFGGLLANFEATIEVKDLFSTALDLLGHKDAARNMISKDRWIASAQHGQVVFPHIFDSNYLDHRTVLLLDGGPGALYFRNEQYPLVTGGLEVSGIRIPPQIATIHDRVVSRPLNLMPEKILKWYVSAMFRLLYSTSLPL